MRSYSPNPAVNETIELLLSLGLPPLPVAPKQDPRASNWYHVSVRHNPEIQSTVKVDGDRALVLGDYCPLDKDGQPIPRFTGKNPSYLDWQGNARPVKHGEFQDRLPSEDELKRWFAHLDTGIGTLGGHAGINWLDFDAKNYPSQEDCDRDVKRVLRDLKAKGYETWVERTGSGGYRIAVRPKETPWFTNFATSPDGNHVGEALFTGRFTVLAPTIHPNGNRYVRLTTAIPAEIDSLESIGIYPSNTADKRGEKRVKRHSGRYSAEHREADAFDIRNFAQYLDSVHERGGMIRFRCPVCDDPSRIDTGFINPVNGAFSCFAGCDPKLIWRDAKAIALAAGYQPPQTSDRTSPALDSKTSFADLLKGLTARLPKISKGFQAPTADEKGIYQFASVEDAIAYGKQNGIDTFVRVDGTGHYKTHEAGLLRPETFGVEKAIALLPDALNPSTETFCDWHLVDGANWGTVRDGDKLRRADRHTPESAKVSPANCVNVGMREALEKRNPHNSAYELACLNCHAFKMCQHSPGMLRADTRDALTRSRVRMAYARASASITKGNLVIADELSKNLESEKQHSVSYSDVIQTCQRLEQPGDESLVRLGGELRSLISGKFNHLAEKRGAMSFDIPLVRFKDELLAMFDGVTVEALEAFESPDIEESMFGCDRRGVALSDKEKSLLNRLEDKYVGTPDQYQEMSVLESLKARTKAQWDKLRLYRKYLLTHEDAKLRDELQQRLEQSKRDVLHPGQLEAMAGDLPNRWLADTLQILLGDKAGHISLGSDGLTLTIREGRQLEAIQAAAFVFVTDGSLAYKPNEEIAAQLGRSPDRVLRFRTASVKPVNNVQRIQITGLGKLGKSRGEGREAAKDGVLAKLREIHPDIALFDYKRFSHDGKLFLDSVGSNDFKDCSAIATTVPRPNIGAILAQYCTRFNVCVDIEDEGFQRYYERTCFDAIRETEGRLRANLRPDQTLAFYILSDGDIPFPVEAQWDVYDIDPELARKGDRTIRNLAEAAHRLGMTPDRINQSALARALGVTQQYISKLISKVKDNLQLILYGLYRKSCTLPKWQIEKAKTLAVAISESAALGSKDTMIAAIDWMTAHEWAIAFQHLTNTGQKSLLDAWISLLDPGGGDENLGVSLSSFRQKEVTA